MTENTEKRDSGNKSSDMEETKKNTTGTVVEVTDEGPLSIKGNFVLNDLKRNNVSTPGEVLLCRCGKSSSQPYCDGSHCKK